MNVSSFDAAGAALDLGITRIEASAGTGKTYALCALVLRLIAEEGLEVGSILVTTFTIPATAELRERIRSLLRGAVEMFDGGPAAHPLLAALQPRYLPRAAEIRPRLEYALRHFDDALISTIHGFCHQLLQERAFESGLPFDAEALEDQSALLLEVAEDFWRQRIYPASTRLGAFAKLAGLTAVSLIPLLAKCVARPTMTIFPAHDAGLLARAEADMEAAFAEVENAWQNGEPELRELFADAGSWAIKEMAKPETTSGRLDGVARCFADAASPIDDYASLDFFTSENVAEQTGKKAKYRPSHPLFDACQRFAEARRAWQTAFQREFLAWAPAELAARKLQRNVLSFDDLLTRLLAALRSRTGPDLIAATRRRFAAALVDEFQDTDPVQAEIFQRLFAGHGRLYFIGDPKQAIYAFRGADIFSYLSAVSHAQHRHELLENQRSVTPLVDAVNAIFAGNPQAFVMPGISFHPARAAGRRDPERLTGSAGSDPALKFWVCPDEKPVTKTAAEKELPRVVADGIIQQLGSDLRRGSEKLKPSDFAVLTATNKQAQSVQRALSEAGLPAVVLSNDSVFRSEEAGEMLALIHALANPAHEAALRAALATTVLGCDALEVARLAEDGPAWERMLERFHQHHTRWLREGFFPAFREFLVVWKVRPRLLALPAGERHLTNLLHLAELLHHAALADRLGPEALARWLAIQMHSATPASEEHELRLESDDNAVKVVTVHKSKGLEFGIVWCPFSWGKAELRDDEFVTFHQDGGFVLDLGSPDYEAHRARTQSERLAEHARLLYVALTRAQLQCHFVWGRFNQCELSAASWVLHPPAQPVSDAVIALSQRKLDAIQLRGDLDALAARVPNAFAMAEVPEPVGARYQRETPPAPLRQARVFTGTIRRDWSIGSFTSLTAAVDADQPDYDRDPSPAPAPTALSGIHAFARGRRAGTCLHEIFEQIDFRDDDAIEPLVARKLAVFSFDRPEFRAAVSDCVRRTLAVELAPGLRLCDVPQSARLNELEFHLPVGRLDPARLQAVLGETLSFSAFSGFLKGFIDLIFQHQGRFYIVDWKSNWLGANTEEYTPAAVAAEMRRHHYAVQYHLYTVALHRHLAGRLGAAYDYARHFGGVFYVFLRGVDPAQPQLGIWRDGPPPERLAAFDSLLAKP